jgi:hypothetical protein
MLVEGKRRRWNLELHVCSESEKLLNDELICDIRIREYPLYCTRNNSPWVLLLLRSKGWLSASKSVSFPEEDASNDAAMMAVPVPPSRFYRKFYNAKCL